MGFRELGAWTEVGDRRPGRVPAATISVHRLRSCRARVTTPDPSTFAWRDPRNAPRGVVDSPSIDRVLGFRPTECFSCARRAPRPPPDSRPRLTFASPCPPIPRLSQFVADGVFFAELNEMLIRELAEDGYSGVEVRVTPMRTEIIIRATRTQNVLGEKGRRIRELTSLVQKRLASLRAPSSSTPRRSPTAASAPSRRRSRSATSSSAVSPCAVRATVSSASSWRTVPRVPRLSCPASSAASVARR